MVESFAFTIADHVLGRLASLALEEVSLSTCVKADLDDLKNTISTIRAVVLDAEEKQSKNHQITDWLRKLKIALYEAEDVVDEFEYDALRPKVSNGITQVRNFFSTSNPLAFRFKMGHKLKKIREKMDKIAADRSKFNLTERLVDMNVVPRRREMTHSYVRPSDIIGREKEKENIVDILMQSSDNKNVSVVPIVGIGGLGKTALASLAYNDDRIVEQFDKRMWVCVTDEFDIEKLIKKILVSAIGGSIGGFSIDPLQRSIGELSIDQLQTQLRGALNNNRFLLVLDDVWNDDHEKWHKLEVLLMDGAPGSKILVTTRKSSVAEIMGTCPTQEIKGLSHGDCLSLFLNCAFKDGQGKQYPNLVKIGNDIVRKCGGVPLAVRSLAGLLYSKVEERDWVSVRDNEIWNLEEREDGILPALKLSYDKLPSYLKQCFVFCSLFAKGQDIENDYLIQLWIARGLIQPSSTNQELEDIGNQYIAELLSISFFQDVQDFKFNAFFKMHDLVHDLALSIAKVDSIKDQDVCFLDNDPQDIATQLEKKSYMRTILFGCSDRRTIDESFLTTCTSRFKYMRVLHFVGVEFKTLPSSIANMKHLRFLQLSGNKKIKKLPNSICKLYHLQTLRVENCSQLKGLPRNIGNLISLRDLEITTKERALPGKNNVWEGLRSLRILSVVKCDNLESMFEGIESLTALRKLAIFYCPKLLYLPLSKNPEHTLEGIRCFTALRSLLIFKCPSLLSLPFSMKHLPALETLIIVDCERLNLMNEDADEDDKTQCSSSRLGYLLIGELPKLEALPRWLVQGPAANTLHSLIIGGCHNLKALGESLENLTSIQKLDICDCPRLSALPEGMNHLATLRVVTIEGCPELSERCKPETGADWHKIAHVPNIHLDGQAIKSATSNN